VNTPLLKYFVKRCRNRIALGHVAPVGFRIAATGCDFACSLFGSVLFDVQHEDAGSATGKRLSDCTTDAASPSRDYGKFAIQAKRV
jgi:hypothetical protein